MSVYFVKGKGWRYDFIYQKTRYTETWFKTKTEAKKAEVKKREEVKNPLPNEKGPTDMAFLDLVNLRLDHVQAYNSESHYTSYKYLARRWVKRWGELMCSQITPAIVQKYLMMRQRVSAYTANQDLRYLRATFNFGKGNKLIFTNPTEGLNFFPVEKRKKYVPPKEDVLKVIAAGNPETQQYLWTIVLTAARVGEINKLTWDDIDLERRVVTLWTRKRKGGDLEPREVPMIEKLFDILSQRFESRDPEMPWVFWHTYWSRKAHCWVKGPYRDRKLLMSILCKNADVKYFRYHALRHMTASILDDLGVPIGVIQRILGHKNRQTTEIYLHSVGEAERAAMNKLEGSRFFRAVTKPDREVPTNMHLAFWNRKVVRPSYEVLKQEIQQMGLAATGRKYGVSDNAVRKWIKTYENEERRLASKSREGSDQFGKSLTQSLTRKGTKNKRGNR
jgi:integrase